MSFPGINGPLILSKCIHPYCSCQQFLATPHNGYVVCQNCRHHSYSHISLNNCEGFVGSDFSGNCDITDSNFDDDLSVMELLARSPGAYVPPETYHAEEVESELDDQDVLDFLSEKGDKVYDMAHFDFVRYCLTDITLPRPRFFHNKKVTKFVGELHPRSFHILMEDMDWVIKEKNDWVTVQFVLGDSGADHFTSEVFRKLDYRISGVLQFNTGDSVVDYVRPKIDGTPIIPIVMFYLDYAVDMAYWYQDYYRFTKCDRQFLRAELVRVDNVSKIFSDSNCQEIALGSQSFINNFVPDFDPCSISALLGAYIHADGIILGVSGLEYKVKNYNTLDLRVKNGVIDLPLLFDRTCNLLDGVYEFAVFDLSWIQTYKPKGYKISRFNKHRYFSMDDITKEAVFYNEIGYTDSDRRYRATGSGKMIQLEYLKPRFDKILSDDLHKMKQVMACPVIMDLQRLSCYTSGECITVDSPINFGDDFIITNFGRQFHSSMVTGILSCPLPASRLHNLSHSQNFPGSLIADIDSLINRFLRIRLLDFGKLLVAIRTRGYSFTYRGLKSMLRLRGAFFSGSRVWIYKMGMLKINNDPQLSRLISPNVVVSTYQKERLLEYFDGCDKLSLFVQANNLTWRTPYNVLIRDEVIEFLSKVKYKTSLIK